MLLVIMKNHNYKKLLQIFMLSETSNVTKCGQANLNSFLFLQLVESMKSYLDISCDPPTFAQVTDHHKFLCEL